MKTITLKEAYKQSPKVPLLNNNTHKVQPNLGLLIKSIADDPDTAALLAHAYNVLPEVVVALKEIENEMGYILRTQRINGRIGNPEEWGSWRLLQSSISKANTVHIP